MITYSIIQKSQLEGALRLDAEYYQPEYLGFNLKLQTQNSKSLGEIGKVAYGTTPRGGIFEKAGIPFVRSQNFSNLLIDTSDLVFCTEEFHKQNKKSATQPSDILFAAVGATIGELAIVQDEIKEGNINQNIARVRITDKNINPYFIGFFFASRSGQLQIERLITGNAQSYLNSEQIKSFLIPVLLIKKQNEIGSYFKEIQKQLENSKSLYSQAENLLLEELGLKDFKMEGALPYTISFLETQKVHRIDAEYFDPNYVKVEKILDRLKQTRLGDISSLISYGTVPTSPYAEDGIPYVKGENLQTCFIDYSKLDYLKKESAEKLPAKFYLKENDIIISQMGTVGHAAVATKAEENWLFASFTIRARLSVEALKILDPLYVALFINNVSRPYYLLRRIAQASIRQNTDLPTVRDMKIPILSKPTQQKIADLVQKSHEARKKAKELLEEAKIKVEELVENKK